MVTNHDRPCTGISILVPFGSYAQCLSRAVAADIELAKMPIRNRISGGKNEGRAGVAGNRSPVPVMVADSAGRLVRMIPGPYGGLSQ